MLNSDHAIQEQCEGYSCFIPNMICASNMHLAAVDSFRLHLNWKRTRKFQGIPGQPRNLERLFLKMICTNSIRYCFTGAVQPPVLLQP